MKYTWFSLNVKRPGQPWTEEARFGMHAKRTQAAPASVIWNSHAYDHYATGLGPTHFFGRKDESSDG